MFYYIDIFGSFNTFTEMLRSSSGLASSIYGVPLSSTSFDALNEMNSLSNSYSVNTYASTSHTELTLPKHNVNFGSLSNNDYSTTNILRPPTKEVLQVIYYINFFYYYIFLEYARFS